MTPLGDLPNKDALLRALPIVLRDSPPVSLVFWDIDNFKPINDTVGHERGTERLSEIANVVEQLAQGKGTLYRYGGDEFCVLMLNSSADEAAGTGERMRKLVANLPLFEGIRNTLSIGIASSEDVKEAEKLIAAADQSMYQAKRLGGNQLAVFNGERTQFVERRRRTARSDLSDLLYRESDVKIIHSELTLGQPLKQAADAYFKDEKERELRKRNFLVPNDPQYDPKLQFRGTNVACVCEVRGSAYLSHSLAEAGLNTKIVSATSSAAKAEMHRQSFISLGGKSNQMTDRLLRDQANKLVTIDASPEDSCFRSKAGRRLTPRRNKDGNDYGLIIMLHPEQYPDKTWLACAGLGEFGTSGAANFLAFSWWMIAKRISELGGRAARSDFACIVSTGKSADTDDDARIFNFALAESDWQTYEEEGC